MTQIWEYIKIALMNIKSNKGRSVLTMLGIIIGISSVIMIISIGNGMRSSINEELENMGGGLIALYTNSNEEGNDIVFTEDDFDLIEEKVEHVKGVTCEYQMWGATVLRRGAEFAVELHAGNEALQYSVGNEPMVRGRYFSQNEAEGGSMVCVINENSARTLFGTTDVVGMDLDLSLWGIEQDLRIVGIRQDSQDGIIAALNGGGYLQVEMPLSTMVSAYDIWIDDFTDMYIVAENSSYVTQVAADALMLMENKFNVRGENKILMETFADAASQYDQILSLITLFISFVAAISLLVGGIGVMNIMLVSVTERTREIGIRKSLGARTKSILLQFLAEAGIITLIGGIIGIVLGALGAIAVCHVMGFAAQVNVSTVLIAAAFSSGVGIFFGIYPAKKAARLSPIEALRHE
ncbi:MAG: ABC transporter permease [Bacteroidales bacterium]|nr:ABC transporter permease [Bacteroidales bacterium]MCM1416537.1 ABC transporter permease [bacterium]MCM1424809.1 ABC transporter permease [bacterium]